jgi:repressor LexA
MKGFPYLGHVPAGGFNVSDIVGSIDGESTVEYLNIGGEQFRLHSLTNSKRINPSNDVKHFILGVSGNSMNEAGIMNGDYVLVRNQQNARSFDIVVAEIFGIDDRATLKRFIRHNGTIYLKPESTDSKYKEFSFSGEDLDFSISGVVIAVLKIAEAPSEGELFQLRTREQMKKFNLLCKMINIGDGEEYDRAWDLINQEMEKNPGGTLLEWISDAVRKNQTGK